MRFKQRNLVWKINIFCKHIKAGAGKRNPFDYARVKKMTRELIRKQRLEAKANKNNNYQF
ncbi:hypothetical protein [Spiroplasma phoeniceum]|uniref:Uncharacterized protein n=1 Tax=Spiroplasma phoeniceum P40 TaxID=1276259 RepID=A0A345DNL2_9MOLU|nr:hypothetical protein [Spiroplasma phoeniceum]AXF95800.1 hypothetical protein SDAV_00817 [Spiroplasma phoeniceum P40]